MSKPFSDKRTSIKINKDKSKAKDKNQVTFVNLFFFQLTLVDKGGDESFLDGICFQVNLLLCVLPGKARLTEGVKF